jgi:hypothetical protein
VPNWRHKGSTLITLNGAIHNAHSYALNLGHQRTNQVFTNATLSLAGERTGYTYDNLGQLKTATGKLADGSTIETLRANQGKGRAKDCEMIKRGDSFSPMNASQNEAKIGYVILNIQLRRLSRAGRLCSSHTAVLVNQIAFNTGSRPGHCWPHSDRKVPVLGRQPTVAA